MGGDTRDLLSQDFDAAQTHEGIGGSGRNFLDPGGLGGTKMPRDPRVVPGFEGLLAALGPLLASLSSSQGAQGITGGSFADQQRQGISGTAQQVQESGAFGNALDSLNSLLSGDAGSGITSNLLSEFNELQRPGLDLAKQFLEADVFEGAARSGTTRSTGTTEALARGFGQIEAGGAQAAGSFAQSVAPSAIGAQVGGIGQALGLPSSTLNMFAGPLGQMLQSQQFQQGLQGQAFGDILSGIPIQEGRLGGKAQGQAGSNIGGFAGMLCWVAREVYGATNPRWIYMRDYVMNEAPIEFQLFYAQYGPHIALEIAANPEAKQHLRGLMDQVLEGAA